MVEANKAFIKASKPRNILIKLIRYMDNDGSGVDKDLLLQKIYEAAEKYGVYLYDFYPTSEGKVEARGFMRDVRSIINAGYGRMIEGSSRLTLTEDGLEYADMLLLEEPIKDTFEKVFNRKLS